MAFTWIRERFFPRRDEQSPFDDEDDDLEKPLEVRTRDAGFSIPEAEDMQHSPELPSSPFAEIRESMRDHSQLCDRAWYLALDETVEEEFCCEGPSCEMAQEYRS